LEEITATIRSFDLPEEAAVDDGLQIGPPAGDEDAVRIIVVSFHIKAER
jgi:hypothetical protein